MLSKKKTGNALINQIIADNENAFQKKMESMGLSTNSSNNKYNSVSKASSTLLDSIEGLGKESLYKAEDGKEYDKSALIKSINNFATAYNNEVSSLSSCGGALNNSFSAELKAAYGENKEKLEAIGITLGDDGKLAINQDKLEAASVDDLKALFAGSSSYMKTLTESANSINEILSKAMAYKSTNYTAKGLML